MNDFFKDFFKCTFLDNVDEIPHKNNGMNKSAMVTASLHIVSTAKK